MWFIKASVNILPRPPLKHTLSCLHGVLVSVGKPSAHSSESTLCGCHVGGSCTVTDVLGAEKCTKKAQLQTLKSPNISTNLVLADFFFPNLADINVETGTFHISHLGDTAHHISSSKTLKLTQKNLRLESRLHPNKI